jgi:hypothetical protein
MDTKMIAREAEGLKIRFTANDVGGQLETLGSWAWVVRRWIYPNFISCRKIFFTPLSKPETLVYDPLDKIN